MVYYASQRIQKVYYLHIILDLECLNTPHIEFSRLNHTSFSIQKVQSHITLNSESSTYMTLNSSWSITYDTQFIMVNHISYSIHQGQSHITINSSGSITYNTQFIRVNHISYSINPSGSITYHTQFIGSITYHTQFIRVNHISHSIHHGQSHITLNSLTILHHRLFMNDMKL